MRVPTQRGIAGYALRFCPDVEAVEARRLERARDAEADKGEDDIGPLYSSSKKRLTKDEIQDGIDLALDDDLAAAFATRPRTRRDCVDGPRPCPWVGCRHHLLVTINHKGTVRLVPGTEGPEDLEHTCALDVANQGGLTLEQVGNTIGLTRERVRQIEEVALEKFAGAVTELVDAAGGAHSVLEAFGAAVVGADPRIGIAPGRPHRR